MNNGKIQTPGTSTAEIAEIAQNYKKNRSRLEYEKRQLEKQREQGNSAAAAETRKRVDELTVTVESLRKSLADAHRATRKTPEEKMIKANNADFIRA